METSEITERLNKLRNIPELTDADSVAIGEAITKLQEQEAERKRMFLAGEQWGVTYHTWFEPDEEDHERALDEALKAGE